MHKTEAASLNLESLCLEVVKCRHVWRTRCEAEESAVAYGEMVEDKKELTS